MLRFAAIRLVQGLLTLWVILSISFVLMRLAPGGPFDKEKPLPAAVVANLKRSFGLGRDVPSPIAGTLKRFAVRQSEVVPRGQPLAYVQTQQGEIPILAPKDMTVAATLGPVGRTLIPGEALLVRDCSLGEQYLRMMWSYTHLDFGVTYASGGTRSVAETLASAFPVSLELGLYALFFAMIFGISLGLLAGWYRNTWLDTLAMTAALLLVSASSLVLGTLLLLVFCVQLQWLSWGGWEFLAWDWPHAQVKILPTLTLGLVYAAWFARLTRAGLLDVVGQNWIRTARAKGLSQGQILRRHALKPAILPAVTFLGPALAGIVTGSVVVERVFSIPGIGEYFVTAAVNRDYPLVMGTVVLYSALLIVSNLAVDIVHAALDPRIRLGAP